MPRADGLTENIAARPRERLVESGVECGEFVGALLSRSVESFLAHRAEVVELFVGAALCGEARYETFESQAHDEEIVGLFASEDRDLGPTARFDFNETLHGK